MELLLIFVLALIFIGPGKMPEVAASVGKMLREFRAASAELTDALNAEIAEAERRKSAGAVAENGNGHSAADAAQAEIVAQGEAEAPPAVEFVAPETVSYQYEPPAPATTIDDVLGALAQQEAEEAAKREAEEKARLEAIALERAIRNGVGPLPESLLLPSTDAPLVVVNPTEQQTPEPAVTDSAEPEAVPAEALASTSAETTVGILSPTSNGHALDVEQGLEPQSGDEAAPDGAAPDGKVAEAESESLEPSGAGQAEVL